MEKPPSPSGKVSGCRRWVFHWIIGSSPIMTGRYYLAAKPTRAFAEPNNHSPVGGDFPGRAGLNRRPPLRRRSNPRTPPLVRGETERAAVIASGRCEAPLTRGVRGVAIRSAVVLGTDAAFQHHYMKVTVEVIRHLDGGLSIMYRPRRLARYDSQGQIVQPTKAGNLRVTNLDSLFTSNIKSI